MSRFAAMVNVALLLAMTVIALGAYTRLTDAGLGCPDWPGCYGKLTAPQHSDHILEAQLNFPTAQIVPHKARNEMVHRYIAGLLGILVLTIFIISYWIKRCRLLATGILLLVIVQAALGMWTVTLNLLPLVVLAHLFGGFLLFTLLAILRMDIAHQQKINDVDEYSGTSESLVFRTHYSFQSELALAKLLPLGYAALLAVILQIALGGWTSSNYAATVCNQLPLCESGWREHFSAAAAFSLPLGHETYEYGVLPYEARMSIHVMHRIGALITCLVVGSFVVLSWRRAASKSMRVFAAVIGTALLLQITLGLINVIAQLPLLNAVGHNLVAATLLMLLANYIRQIKMRQKDPSQTVVDEKLVSDNILKDKFVSENLQ
jgi:heme a synthase